MTDPKATDKVLGDIMTQLETLTTHVSDAAKRVGETLFEIAELKHKLFQINSRLSTVENKTHGLSLRPAVRNCIHCGHILRGVQNRCGTCGKEQ